MSVFDRGFDAEELVWPIDDLKIAYIIRQRGDHLAQRLAGRRRRAPRALRKIADAVRLRYGMKIWHRDKATDRWEQKQIRHGFCPLYWAVTEKVYTLVVVSGWGKEPLMLWTNLSVREEKSARYVVPCYSRRWAVEDAGRVLKQEFQRERVRVKSWQSIRRTIILAGLAYSFLAQIGRLRKALVRFLTEQVRAFHPLKKVWTYRIRQGLAELWKEGLRFRFSDFR